MYMHIYTYIHMYIYIYMHPCFLYIEIYATAAHGLLGLRADGSRSGPVFFVFLTIYWHAFGGLALKRGWSQEIPMLISMKIFRESSCVYTYTCILTCMYMYVYIYT